MGHFRHIAIATLLAMVATLFALPAQASEPLKLMIVGDSVAQGKVGDYTWRYRLWQEFDDQREQVDFVGPRDDLHVDSKVGGTPQDYADPHFDRDHAALWGASYALLDLNGLQAAILTRAYEPEVVVIALGLNDLTWFGLSPARVRDSMAEYVAVVRAVAPDADVVLAHAPQHWRTGVVEFNGLVDELASTTPRSAVANLDRDFHEIADTYDSTHPSASGERKIAGEVGAALTELGHLGKPPVVEPRPGVGPVQPGDDATAVKADRVPKKPRTGKPARLKVRVAGHRLKLRWSAVPDSKRYRVRVRGPQRLSRMTKRERLTSPRLRRGRYVVSVRTVGRKGAARTVVRIR